MRKHIVNAACQSSAMVVFDRMCNSNVENCVKADQCGAIVFDVMHKFRDDAKVQWYTLFALTNVSKSNDACREGCHHIEHRAKIAERKALDRVDIVMTIHIDSVDVHTPHLEL